MSSRRVGLSAIAEFLVYRASASISILSVHPMTVLLSKRMDISSHVFDTLI